MTITIQRLSAEDIHTRQNELIELLRDVVDGGSSVNFIAPLDLKIAAAYWEKVAREAAAHERVLLVALEAGQIVGTAQLVLATQPNGLHRAEVQKVLVHSRARRRGIASQLMYALEEEARTEHRHLLVLDTEEGSGGEKLYAQVGYQRAGSIPQFARNAQDDGYCTTVLFYKLLA